LIDGARGSEGLIYLALAITCSLTIGAIFKYAAQRGMDRIHLLVANYLAATLCAAAGLLLDGGQAISAIGNAQFLLFGVVAGVVLIGAFFVFALATARAGMSVTIAVTRIGVSIPFLISWLAWGEVPGLAQWIGLAMVAWALYLITRLDHPDLPRPRPAGVVWVLVLCFLAGGMGDLMFKAFDVWHAAHVTQDGFIAVAFGTSFLVGLGVVWSKPAIQRLPARATLVWGVALGLANYASVLFILGAVANLPGTIVFPTHAVSVVVGGAIIGAIVWREHLSRTNIAGVVVAAVAVILLNG
jgi:drug/metabolite transporter (DMT)-like permease